MAKLLQQDKINSISSPPSPYKVYTFDLNEDFLFNRVIYKWYKVDNIANKGEMQNEFS